MEFNIWVAIIFMVAWLVQIVLAAMDESFSYNEHKGLDLPLSRHWGVMIGDPILAVMNGFIFPHLGFGWHSLPLLVVSGLISWQLHKLWWNIRGHIFPDHLYSEIMSRASGRPEITYWRQNLSKAGWCHLIYFIFQLEIIFEFAATPMPETAVKTITALLLVFAPFGVFQPGWAEWSRKRLRDPKATWFWRSLFSLLAMWAAILVVYYAKT